MTERWADTPDEPEPDKDAFDPDRARSQEPQDQELEEEDMAHTFRRDPDDEDDYIAPLCPTCGGEGVVLGSIGFKMWHRCRACGGQFSKGQELAEVRE